MTTRLPSIYQDFIHISRYARYNDALGRRETWDETVDRYIAFFQKRTNNNKKVPWEEIRNSILNLEVMPSMRCLMTAGTALEKDQVAGYNCSYVVVDSPKSFDEIMYILMCGTGVGFSIESRYTNKLPEVPDEIHPSDTTVVFADSKVGWASGYPGTSSNVPITKCAPGFLKNDSQTTNVCGWTSLTECQRTYFYDYCAPNQLCSNCYGKCGKGLFCDVNTSFTPKYNVDTAFTCGKTPEPQKKTDWKEILIIGSISGGAILILIVLLIFFTTKKKNQEPNVSDINL